MPLRSHKWMVVPAYPYQLLEGPALPEQKLPTGWPRTVLLLISVFSFDGRGSEKAFVFPFLGNGYLSSWV